MGQALNTFELSSLADALDSNCFEAGEDIITQGDIGTSFYILEGGSAAAFIDGVEGEKKVRDYSSQGDYFGETALLQDTPRRATIRATGDGCNVVWCSKETFFNILGPIAETL